MAKGPSIVLTCEHGGNLVPARYRHLFAGRERRLTGHQGWDAGALSCARALGRRLAAPLFHARTTRLLIDLNRSEHHRALYSDISRALPERERVRLLDRYYRPYRRRVEDWTTQRITAGGVVVHVSVHSFTPVLNGAVRRADIGLLYDPRRTGEARLCHAWQQALRTLNPRLRVRRNYPYRGTSDGFTRYLRGRFPAKHYLGIELEINQSLLSGSGARRTALAATLAVALRHAMATIGPPHCGPATAFRKRRSGAADRGAETSGRGRCGAKTSA